MLSQIEKSKYEQVWGIESYRDYSPGMENVERFLSVIKPKPGETLIDLGCGEGKAGLAFFDFGLGVTWLDLTDAALDPRVDRAHFIEQPLWLPGPGWAYDYGFCCDVLEHIPPQFVGLTLARIIEGCSTAWLQVCNEPDNFGARIGQPLHLTVQPFTWWRDTIGEIATVTDARDLCGTSLFVVRRQ